MRARSKNLKTDNKWRGEGREMLSKYRSEREDASRLESETWWGVKVA